MHLIGTEMDYVDDDLRSEFVFNNPNAKVILFLIRVTVDVEKVFMFDCIIY
jgi:hypothetical protein